MDNGDVKEIATADPAEAEEEKITAAELKKFKDVAALQKAYLSLEAEFTRRSQRLKELESEAAKPNAPQRENASAPAGAESADPPKAGISEEQKRAVIEEYLSSVAQNRGVPVILGGVQVAAPASSPKTVKEAGRLAQEFLKG